MVQFRKASQNQRLLQAFTRFTSTKLLTVDVNEWTVNPWKIRHGRWSIAEIDLRESFKFEPTCVWTNVIIYRFKNIILISNDMILLDKVYSKNLRFIFFYFLWRRGIKNRRRVTFSNVLNSMWLNQIKFFRRTSRFKTVLSKDFPNSDFGFYSCSFMFIRSIHGGKIFEPPPMYVIKFRLNRVWQHIKLNDQLEKYI